MNKSEYRFAAMYGAKYIPYLRDRIKRRPSEIRHVNISNLVKSCTWLTWDFDRAHGDTIREKYENLYILCFQHALKLVEQKVFVNVLIANQEISSVFEITSTSGFSPSFAKMKDDIMFMGTINNRWKLHSDPMIDHDILLVCDEKVEKGFVIRILQKNFFWR